MSFRSDTPAVCSVSGATVTATTAGTCTVTASQAGDNRYLAAPSITESFQINAGHQAQTITFPPPPQAKVGEPVTLTASATSGPGSGVPVGYAADLHGLGLHPHRRRGWHLRRHSQPERQ